MESDEQPTTAVGPDLTHIDAAGNARMVDVSEKTVSHRLAIAEGCVTMRPETLSLIMSGKAAKGDVLAVARVAGIMAAKRTGDLIPLCHPLGIESVAVELKPAGEDQLLITATVGVTGRTGVEMEALTAVAVAGLTVYDMCKAVDKEMEVGRIHLKEKIGGRSGHYRRAAKAT
nr:cyclic pyranopterin monophosphate synthase MoaC [Nonomuraea guangzhouensis]